MLKIVQKPNIIQVEYISLMFEKWNCKHINEYTTICIRIECALHTTTSATNL